MFCTTMEHSHIGNQSYVESRQHYNYNICVPVSLVRQPSPQKFHKGLSFKHVKKQYHSSHFSDIHLVFHIFTFAEQS